MKSFSSLLLAFIASIAIPSQMLGFEVNGINYQKTSDDEVGVTYYSAVPNTNTQYYSGDIIIPAAINYEGSVFAVSSILRNAFVGCSTVTSVSIPESVTSIGESAFRNCSALTTLSLPESVTSIGSRAFSGCAALVSINLPSDIKSIEQQTFSGCAALVSINLPSDIKSIEQHTFSGCSSLEAVNIPEKVTSIGNSAFRGCTKVSSVVLPDAVTNLGDYAFAGCSSLTAITIPENVKSIGLVAFSDCNSLKELVFNAISCSASEVFPNSLEKVTFGDKVTSISNGFLYNGSQITELELPASLTSIGSWAFNNCSYLKEATIPEAVTSIGEGAFRNTAIQSLTFNARECNNVFGSTWATFPKSVTELSFGPEVTVIPNNFLQEGSKVDSISFPESLITIGENSFRSNTSLIAVEIPENVVNIGNSAFYNCTALTDLTFNAVRCTSSGRSEYSPLFPETIKNVKIGDKVTLIPPYFLCGSGIQSINLPNSLYEIGHSAFYNSNLRSVILPPSIIAVQSGAFKSCYNISKVAYPEDFPNPFPYGRAIAYPRDCFIDDSGVIYDAQKTTLYFAPIEIEGAYQTLPSTTSIVESAFYNCDKLNEITITDDIAEIGSGAFSGCENLIKLSYLAINCKNASNYNMFPNSIESLIVGDKVTSIPDYFLNWINSNTTPSSSLVLKELSLPASLTSIGVAAFCGLEVVTLITIPEGVKSIGDWAFSYCTKLDTLSLPQSLSSIGNFTFAFSNPSVVTSLSAEPPACGNNAFYSPKGTLYVPAESIDDYANAPVWQSFSSIKSIPVLVSSVEVTPETLSGAVGQTAQLTASVTPADASNPALMWISADPEVASVDQNGLVTFISGGATTITVSSTDGSDVSVIIPVTVNDPSGVDDVNLGNTVKIDVFTLDGVSILHNASTSHLSKLAKGIYILKSDDTVQKIIIK